MAMLSMTQGRLEEAVSFFTRAVQAAPGFVEARRYRSIALARSSAWEQSSRDLHWCLEREPGSGETLYAAACVSSLAASSPPTPTLKPSVINPRSDNSYTAIAPTWPSETGRDLNWNNHA